MGRRHTRGGGRVQCEALWARVAEALVGPAARDQQPRAVGAAGAGLARRLAVRGPGPRGARGRHAVEASPARGARQAQCGVVVEHARRAHQGRGRGNGRDDGLGRRMGCDMGGDGGGDAGGALGHLLPGDAALGHGGAIIWHDARGRARARI